MEPNEFFSKFANVKLEARFQLVNSIKFGMMSFTDAYNEINRLEDQIRPLRIDQRTLIDECEEYILKNQAS